MENVTTFDNSYANYSAAGWDSLGSFTNDVEFNFRFLHLALSLPIIVCSSLVLYAVHVFRQLRHKHTPFLVSLCLADVMTGIASILCNAPHVIPRRLGEGFSRPACLWCTYLSYAAPTTAWATVLLVTLERFLSVTPVHGLLKDYNRTVVTLTVIWILTWTGGCFIFEWNQYTPSRPCHLEWVMPVFIQRVLLVLISGALIVHAAMYGHVLLKSCRYSAAVHPETAAPASVRRRHRDKGVHRMILIIVASRIACWIPLLILFSSVRSGYVWIQPLRGVAYTMVLCSSLINPVVYYLYSSSLKATVSAYCAYYCCSARCYTQPEQTDGNRKPAAGNAAGEPRSAVTLQHI